MEFLSRYWCVGMSLWSELAQGVWRALPFILDCERGDSVCSAEQEYGSTEPHLPLAAIQKAEEEHWLDSVKPL